MNQASRPTAVLALLTACGGSVDDRTSGPLPADGPDASTPDATTLDQTAPPPPTDAPDAGAQDADAEVPDAPSADAGQCPPGRSLCGLSCVDLQGDLVNCGRCGNWCSSPYEMCSNGSCVCSKGTLCGTDCIWDITADPMNCGGCGRVCTNPNSACINGTCGPPPIPVVTGVGSVNAVAVDAQSIVWAAGIVGNPSVLAVLPKAGGPSV